MGSSLRKVLIDHRQSRRLLSALAITMLAGLALGGEARASGTASISGDNLVYTGDDTTEHVVIDKEPISNDNGDTVGAQWSVQDIRGGGVAKGSSPCGPHQNFDAFCPFGSATLKVKLGGGADTFISQDQTLGLDFSCSAFQAVAPVVLDGGRGSDFGLDGTRLGDTMAGGPGNDALASWDGNDRVSGGSGRDLVETGDGNDVADGGSGNDVISLDSPKGLHQPSCFAATGKGHDIGRGGPGNDSVGTEGSGKDRVEGGTGNDSLSAGKGRDKLYGGPGRDTIYSRDGQRDYVNCGSGRDKLLSSDRKDRVVGCEKRFLRPQ